SSAGPSPGRLYDVVMTPPGRGRFLAGVGTLALVATACLGGGGPAPSGPPTSAPPSSVAPGHRQHLRVRRASFVLPSPVQRSVAWREGDVVDLAGGLNAADTSVSTVLAIDVRAGTVRRLGDVARPFHDAAAGVIGGRLVVFAGGAGAGSDLVQSFDPRTGTTRLDAAVPRSLSDLASAQTGGTVYLVGGYDGVHA